MRPARVPVSVETAAPDGETNTYVFGSANALLVDPADETKELDEALEEVRVENVLVTHTHPDHVGAVERYAEDGATIWAHAGFEDRFGRVTGVSPDDTFREGTVIETDDGPLEVLSMPGHAPDHVALAFDGGAVVGDLAVESGSVVVGVKEGGMRAYLTALRRLHAHNHPRLYPGHGPIIENPRAVLERLISHRLHREKRVRAAVHSGAQTVAEITDTAYEKDVSGVQRLAESTVEAHLEKLAVEGSIEWDGERAGV